MTANNENRETEFMTSSIQMGLAIVDDVCNHFFQTSTP